MRFRREGSCFVLNIHKSYYETLYSRPVVALSGYCAKYDLPDSLYAYLAYGGTTGSAKDALAEGMLALATEKGLLQPGQTVIECSSGSFAVALAVACAHSRHPLMLCMPATVPLERQQMLTKFGAQIVLSNYVYGRRGVEQRAQEAVEQTGGYFLNYFDNAQNAFVSAYRKYSKDNSFNIKVEYISTCELTGKTLIIADPMLATGSSLVMTYNALVEKAGMPKFTHVATVIGSEEGVEYAKKHLSANNCKIWCGSLDAEMTVKSYIVPGMGDAGDLAYGEKL